MPRLNADFLSPWADASIQKMLKFIWWLENKTVKKRQKKRSQHSLIAASWAPDRSGGSLSHRASVVLTEGCHSTLGLGPPQQFMLHPGCSGLSVWRRKHDVRRHVNGQTPAPPLLKAMQYAGNGLFCQQAGQTQTTTLLFCTTQ